MDDKIRELDGALRAVLSTMKPCELADELGIHNAHVYRARKGYFSPKLVRAMRRADMLPPRPPYPYFKIRRDDPARAAAQILDALGREYAIDLTSAICGFLQPEDDWSKLLPNALGASRRSFDE